MGNQLVQLLQLEAEILFNKQRVWTWHMQWRWLPAMNVSFKFPPTAVPFFGRKWRWHVDIGGWYRTDQTIEKHQKIVCIYIHIALHLAGRRVDMRWETSWPKLWAPEDWKSPIVVGCIKIWSMWLWIKIWVKTLTLLHTGSWLSDGLNMVWLSIMIAWKCKM